MSAEEVEASAKTINDVENDQSPVAVEEEAQQPLSQHEEPKSSIKTEQVHPNSEPKPAAAIATATVEFDGYVCVASSEGDTGNLLEIPVENDNTLKLSTLEHSFPNAIGLKFKNEATGVFRTLAVSDDARAILEPKGGWGTRRYVAIFRSDQQAVSGGVAVMKGLKRPAQSSAMMEEDLSLYGRDSRSDSDDFSHNPHSGISRYHQSMGGAMGQDGGDFGSGGIDSGDYPHHRNQGGLERGREAVAAVNVRSQPTAPVDLVVLNIDFTTRKEALVKYFEKFGKVEFAEIKLDRITGKSKGYGFIKMSTLEEQQKVLDTGHLIDGRVIEVRIPIRTHDPEAKKTRADMLSTKIHVGRVPDDFTLQDLYKGFSEKAQEMSPHARVDRVIIPHPRRGFAFVTFNDATVTKRFIEMQDVVIGGASVAVSYPTPRKDMEDMDFAGSGLDQMGAYSVGYTPGMPAAATGISSSCYRQFASGVPPGSLGMGSTGFGGMSGGISAGTPDGFGGGNGGLMSSGRAGMSSPIGGTGGVFVGGSNGLGSPGGAGGLLPPQRSYGYFHPHQQAGGQQQKQQLQQSAFGSTHLGYGASGAGGGIQSYGSGGRGGHLGGRFGGQGGMVGTGGAYSVRGGAVRSGGVQQQMGGGRYGNMEYGDGDSGSVGSHQIIGQQSSGGYGQPPKSLGGGVGEYGY